MFQKTCKKRAKKVYNIFTKKKVKKMENMETNEARSSIEVTKNTKGYTWKVKVYYEQGQEQNALANLQSIEQQLKQQYGEQ